MLIRDTYKSLSPEELAKYYDVLLFDIFHHIQAFLLYPPHCSCKDICLCDEMREKIVLSLNLNYLDNVIGKSSERFSVADYLLEIPETSAFMEIFVHGYPIWLTKKELKKKEESHLFKDIADFVWNFISIATTSEAPALDEMQVNPIEVTLVTQPPLSRKTSDTNCTFGDKINNKHLNKSIWHLIAAMEYVKRDKPLNTAKQIKLFLDIAKGIREKLLSIPASQQKKEYLFSKKDFRTFPDWVQVSSINIFPEPSKTL